MMDKQPSTSPQARQPISPPAEYRDLRAVFVNCTLKRSPELSHTEGLLNHSIEIMRSLGVHVDVVRLADHDIASGVYPDMREHGWERDDWPDDVWPLILRADILVAGGPIWLGDNSSNMRKLIERLYAMSGETNERGQYVYYGKVGGAIITGNEDGAKHAAQSILYSLQHIGYTIPPAADAAWLGEIGPGPSYRDPESGSADNDFTNRNTTFMTWNLLHLARLLKDAGGIPAYGNVRSEWNEGERWGFDENPEYR